MESTVLLGVVAIAIAIIIGGWQIYLAWKQIQISKRQGANVSQDQPAITKQSEPATAPNQATISAPKEYGTEPYPIDVIGEIDKLPPAQRQTARNAYLGLTVRWRTSLYAIHVMRGTIVKLMLLDRGHYPWVYCEIDISEYPEAKIAKQNHGLWVSGEISIVEAGVIELANCKVKFD